MAKRYIITEAQYKEILDKLSINEQQMNEFGSFDDFQEPNDPGYALVDVRVEEHEGWRVVAFLYEEEGTGRVFKGSLDEDDLAKLGENVDSVISQFQALKQVDKAVDDAAWKTAEYLHDGQDDSDFSGNE